MPSDFIHDHRHPIAINYPTISYETVISSTDHDGDVHGMTQKSSIHQGSNSEDDIFQHSSDEEDATVTNKNHNGVSPYNQLKTSFKAMTSIMDGNCDQDDIGSVERFFTEMVAKFTKKVMNQSSTRVHPPEATYISSNPPASKKRKHHGCRGY